MTERSKWCSRWLLAVGAVVLGLWAAWVDPATASEPAGPPPLPTAPQTIPNAAPPTAPQIDIERGNALCLLADDFVAARARIELIESARCRIDVVVFGIEGDWFAYGMLGLLRDAARRGVQVRIVVDALYHWVPGPVREYLVESGIRIREYHPWRGWGGLRYNFRLHDKLLVVDGQAMIVGGRNIAASYFGRGETKNFHDRGVLIHGPASLHGEVYFQHLWGSNDLLPDNRRTDPLSLLTAERVDANAVGQTLTASAQRLRAEYLQGGCGACGTGCVVAERVQFLHSKKAFQSPCPDITPVLRDIVSRARREVLVETPYAVFPDEWLDEFEEARRRGVRVVLLTNSLHTTDHICVHAAYVNRKQRLLDMGVELYEYDGTRVLHAKSLVVDDVAVFPTYNFNYRSQNLDSEIAVIAYDPRIAAGLRGLIFVDIAQSQRVHSVEHPLDVPRCLRQPKHGRYPLMQVGRIMGTIMAPYY
jgi:phosphatidylserine/phosphatidylglycerophosphate/cardiolipin synthase-like enzyme